MIGSTETKNSSQVLTRIFKVQTFVLENLIALRHTRSIRMIPGAHLFSGLDFSDLDEGEDSSDALFSFRMAFSTCQIARSSSTSSPGTSRARASLRPLSCVNSSLSSAMGLLSL